MNSSQLLAEERSFVGTGSLIDAAASVNSIDKEAS
jgi:hypothetical protein